mmetsp:Transcript_76637/g.216737  ORF Transcript_76637/g.216737 Transcript_76637/m.216737 type:complete len:317 (-) Transcript_76637:190-1140(-)
MRPYFGVCFFVFSARNSAFSAPRIWTVLDGCFARLMSEPAWEMSRAPTSSPTMYVRFGAMALMRSFKYSASDARYSVSSITRSHSMRMFVRSSSVISVPMEVSAAALTSAAISSGTPTLENSVSLAFVFMPMSFTTLAYTTFSVTILPISGKCHPYHSRSRMAKLLSSLSRSSRSPTAWMIIVSTLSGENFSLNRDSVCESPSAMDFSSVSLIPSISSVRCILIPRMISFRLSFSTAISMLSFLVTSTPSALSSTASFSPSPGSTMFFLRNFFKLFPATPSVRSVAASIAALVSAKLWNALRLTWRCASPIAAKLS